MLTWVSHTKPMRSCARIPTLKSTPSEMLHAAEYTLEEVMKSLNKWMDFIVCLDVGLGSDEDRDDLT